MKSKPTQSLKEKSACLKMRSAKLQCPCIRLILSILKNKKQRTTVSATSATVTHKITDEDKKTESYSIIKKAKNSRVIRLPKIRCMVSFLTNLFNELSRRGELRMDASGIARAVDIISNVKMNLDGGKAWNGKIEIAENLHLKLYKSGLVLHHRQ